MLSTLLMGAASGGASGAAAGFLGAMLVLAARRVCNGHLARRGQLPVGDLVLPPWTAPSAVVGAVAGAIASALRGLWEASVVALAFPLILTVVCVVRIAIQTMRRTR
jgi:hypothetical protein